jgi:hypothetical protein
VIVVFLTKTNKFVSIDPPIPESEIEDNIRKINSNNYLIADIKTQVNNNVDLKLLMKNILWVFSYLMN